MKFLHYFLCAVLVFCSTLTSAFASSTPVNSTGYDDYALPCFYLFQSLPLTNHSYYLSNDGGVNIGRSFSIGANDSYVLSFISSYGTVSVLPTNPNVTTITSDITTYYSNYKFCTYYISTGNNEGSFNVNVGSGTWIIPIYYGSVDTDSNDYLSQIPTILNSISSKISTTNANLDDIKTILNTINSRVNTTNSRLQTANNNLNTINDSISVTNDLLNITNTGIGVTNDHLFSVNNHFVTLHNEMALVNFQLLDISDKLSYNSNSSINDNVSTTNSSLTSGIDSLESIESSNMSNLNSNLINVSTSSTTNWIFSSSPLLAATSFISEQLTNIYNANTNLKSFTNTILVIGFAFLMLGVAL